MKFTLVLLALAGIFAQAAPTIKASDYTCSEVQTFVAEHGEAFIISGFFGGGSLVVSDSDYCDRGETFNGIYVTTSDKTFCLAGLVCKDDGRYGN